MHEISFQKIRVQKISSMLKVFYYYDQLINLKYFVIIRKVKSERLKIISKNSEAWSESMNKFELNMPSKMKIESFFVNLNYIVFRMRIIGYSQYGKREQPTLYLQYKYYYNLSFRYTLFQRLNVVLKLMQHMLVWYSWFV